MRHEEEQKMNILANFVTELFDLDVNSSQKTFDVIRALADTLRRRGKLGRTNFTELNKRHEKFCNSIEFIISNLRNIDVNTANGELNHYRICTEMSARAVWGGESAREKSKLIRELLSLKDATNRYMENVKRSRTYSRAGRPSNIHKNIGDDYNYSKEYGFVKGILVDVVGLRKIVSIGKCQDLLFKLIELDIDGFKFDGFGDASLDALVKDHRKRRKALEES